MARNHFSFEKRRKEKEKKAKKEAKREARAERKAAAGEVAPEPVVVIDEWGNAVTVEPGSDEDGPSGDATEDNPDQGGEGEKPGG